MNREKNYESLEAISIVDFYRCLFIDVNWFK